MSEFPSSCRDEAAPAPSGASRRALGGSESASCECDFRLLCDRSPAGIYVVQDGRIYYANPALGEVLGRPIAHLVGRPALEFIHAHDRAEVEAAMAEWLDGESDGSRLEVRCLGGDGDAVDVEVTGSRMDLGGRSALVGAMVDISARKSAERSIDERVRFERMLADLSARFVNLPPEEIRGQIQHSLKTLVNFLGNDRSTLVEFGEDEREVLVTHSYATPGCEPFPQGPLEVESLPWFIGQFRSGAMVFLRDLPDELPPDAVSEREYCTTYGVKSNITLPLMSGGVPIGGITFAFLTRPCEWPAEVVTRLRLIAEVFANAILRRRADEALRVALAENRKLQQKLTQENQYLREQAVLKHKHGRIIGHSDAITRVLYEAERVASTDAPVLLLGETGTGKELLAQAIHGLSRRSGRTMVVVNCASLPATLIESELFGREAGAYTGAASAQVGRFVVADHSTLFLDEVAELPVELQAKLLRVLQDGRFERLGSPKTLWVDVRIIAATNRDLAESVREGTFRADLYHRLNVFPIHLPPLRERCEDIPPLVWAFVEALGSRMGKSIKNIPRKTMRQLQQYSWPGNVRELSNVVERAMILANNETLSVELPTEAQGASARLTLEESDRAHILQTVTAAGWRIRGSGGAAELLGMKPTTLEARMAKLRIKRPTKD